MSVKLKVFLITLWLLFFSQYCLADDDVSCSVTVNMPVSFGTYNPISGSPLNSNGTVSETCTNTAPPAQQVTLTIALSKGTAGSYSPRTMNDGAGHTLQYNLYVTAPPGAIWGDGTGGTSTQSVRLTIPPRTSRNASQTIFGQMPALQTSAVPGSYSDSITVTVTY